MKRNLSLLLSMVLAMTMVMGIGVTAFATPFPSGKEVPDICECTDGEHPNVWHFYSTGETYTHYSLTFVEGRLFGYPDNDLSHYIDGYLGGEDAVDLGMFNDGCYSEGWYYLSSDIFYSCSGHSSTPSPDPILPTSGPTSSAHTHNFQWQTITAPTKDADGLEGEVCSCGATRNTQKLSAYAYSLNEYATPMINAAKAGQTITFEFGEWNSFPKSFMAKLVDKSAQNVAFVFHYKWNHVKQEITIPAGTPIDLNFDWYGPAKMAELYGMN